MADKRLSPVVTGLLSITLAAMPVAAQVEEDTAADDSDETVEEVVVYGNRKGDPDSADPLYAEILRQQVIDEVERLRLEEEEDWRNMKLSFQRSEQSRIVWGYDPKEDRDRFDQLDRDPLPGDVKPATLFRAKF